MHALFLLFLVVFNQYTVYGQNEDTYCYSTDKDKSQSRHYATKTSYKLVAQEPNLRALRIPEGCEPAKIWILSRHGTRLPDRKFIEKMKSLTGIKNEISRNTNKKLCNPDKTNLQVWKVNSSITPDKENLLVPQGAEEIRLLAERFKDFAPTVLRQAYDQNKFRFYTSDTQRTKDSANIFAAKLFGLNVTKSIPITVLNDSFIRPHEVCDEYKEQNKAYHDDPESEIHKFEVSNLLNTTVLEIANRLGFNSLNNEDVYLIWDICRYEEAWSVNRVSTWCAAFTKTQNKVLEYRQDLKYYYKSGHGHENNSRLACYAVQDMLKHFESNEQPQLITYFSHSALVQLFLVALGVFKDNQPLKADNFDQMENRQWQTSSISPFTANVVAIKYNCEPNDPKIQFLLNEKPLQIEGCNVGLCDLSSVLQKYEKYYNANCQEFYCNNNGNNFKIPNCILITPLITLYILFNVFRFY